jgi:parallel beta-helix repeat protein
MKEFQRKGIVMGIVLILISVVFAAVPMNVSAGPSIIYIKSDGTVSPSTAPISRVGDYYTLTANINKPIFIEKSGVTLDGDYHKSTGAKDHYGVYIYQQSDITVKNLNLEKWIYSVFLYESDSNSIIDCTMVDNQWNGMRMWDSEYNYMTINSFSDNPIGLLLDQSNNNMITENKFVDNNHGLRLEGDYNVAFKNRASYNSVGISVSADSNSIKQNLLTYNTQHGIHMNHADGNEVSENVISYNGRGIYFYDSNGNTICGNEISYNSYGLHVQWSINNMLYYNNILSNAVQAMHTDSSNTWDDGAGRGNYWNDYTGVDLDSDGVGDTKVPHPDTDHGNGYYQLDSYPLVAPWSPDPIEDLIDDVEDLGLPAGIENSLVSKLENAKKQLEKGHENAAMNLLEAFINQVEALRGKKLTDAEADALIQAAQAIIDSI